MKKTEKVRRITPPRARRGTLFAPWAAHFASQGPPERKLKVFLAFGLQGGFEVDFGVNL